MQLEVAGGQTCGDCGAAFPDAVLACPRCQKLVHSERLRELSAQAEQASATGDTAAELAAWREALGLLPPQSRQHAIVQDKTLQLSAAAMDGPAASTAAKPESSRLPRSAGALSALGLFLWKAKALVFFALTKLKLLLLGLTKVKTLFSMLLTMGVYFTLWGWPFAIGFVLSIYVHEMGHVAALRRLGIPASAPMFIPGLGAYVRMHSYPATPAEDARVGLAGPIWGLGAALFCLLVYRVSGQPIWGALAHAGAYLNLFNLVPVWQLDGARGFAALDKQERMLATCALLLAWVFTHETLLLIIAAVAAYRTFFTAPAEASHRRAFLEYVGLVAALSSLLHVHVPLP